MGEFGFDDGSRVVWRRTRGTFFLFSSLYELLKFLECDYAARSKSSGLFSLNTEAAWCVAGFTIVVAESSPCVLDFLLKVSFQALSFSSLQNNKTKIKALGSALLVVCGLNFLKSSNFDTSRTSVFFINYKNFYFLWFDAAMLSWLTFV